MSEIQQTATRLRKRAAELLKQAQAIEKKQYEKAGMLARDFVEQKIDEQAFRGKLAEIFFKHGDIQ